MEIREAAIAAMGRAELEELIDRAVRPDVPLRVLFAALDRYTALLRPILGDEAATDAAAPAAPAAPSAPRAPHTPAHALARAAAELPALVLPVSILPVTPRPPRPTGPPGPSQ